MKCVRNVVSKFLSDESGMETVEWGVLAALIVAGLVTVVSTLGKNINTAFNKLNNATS